MKILKRLAAAAVAVCVMLMLASCDGTKWEDANYYEYKCPEGMRLLTTETIDSCADILEYLGLKKEDVLQSMSQNKMLFSSFLPHTEEGQEKPTFPTEMFMTVSTSAYVSNIYNLNRLTEEEFAKELENNSDTSDASKNGYEMTQDVSVIENNGAKYFKYVYTFNDPNAGENASTQYVTQYVTIYNGFAYSFYCATSVNDDPQIDAKRDEFFSSIRFTQTLEAKDPYDPEWNTFTHSFTRFMKNNWLEVVIVAAVTVLVTILLLIFNDRGKKNGKKGKKNDGIVRADYLK